MKKLRVGIVGTGYMGELHAKVYVNNPNTEIVAVCDLNETRASAMAQKFGAPRYYNSHRLMLENEEIDLVSVCTPDFAHAEPAIDSANAKKHVLIEKPLAVTVEDAEAIISAAKKNDVKIMTQFSHRWVPAYRQAKGPLS